MDACGNETLSTMAKVYYDNLPYHEKQTNKQTNKQTKVFTHYIK